MTTQPTTGNPAAERRNTMAETLRATFDLRTDKGLHQSKWLDAALLHERRATVERIREGLWFLNPTQQEKAEAVYATASEEEARP